MNLSAVCRHGPRCEDWCVLLLTRAAQALWLRIALLALLLEPSQNLPRLLRHDSAGAADSRGGDAALRELVRRQAVVVRCVDCPQLEAAGWCGLGDAVDKLLAGVRDRRVLAASADAASAGIVDHLLALVHTGRAQVCAALVHRGHRGAYMQGLVMHLAVLPWCLCSPLVPLSQPRGYRNAE